MTQRCERRGGREKGGGAAYFLTSDSTLIKRTKAHYIPRHLRSVKPGVVKEELLTQSPTTKRLTISGFRRLRFVSNA